MMVSLLHYISNLTAHWLSKIYLVKKKLQGLWKVNDGFLFIKVISGEFIVEYQIVGNTQQNIHCGIEYINGRLSTYSKFIQTK
ncbi:hypothetical protein VAE130_600291 [Vibrio aestuarianus]|nr:hypothetical protein VAE055_420289 [Vibrio aestuarianus]CAH8222828.1 hypothetical protein VAE128_500281 [Vibrio aestuarianus]CAH8222832.1 hypothetical protein VAE032_320284 [Vibrio aestuarianus]CAH8223309.1 hypothetical protein VAE115_370286 [Vibrio aestuarianus]CAH8223356.1 hypothetical protein VAE130_600291 [Vibrio aestuarianus]